MIWFVFVSIGLFFLMNNTENKELSIHARMALKMMFFVMATVIFVGSLFSFLFVFAFVKQGNEGWWEYFQAFIYSAGLTALLCGAPFALVKIYKLWYAHEEKKS